MTIFVFSAHLQRYIGPDHLWNNEEFLVSARLSFDLLSVQVWVFLVRFQDSRHSANLQPERTSTNQGNLIIKSWMSQVSPRNLRVNENITNPLSLLYLNVDVRWSLAKTGKGYEEWGNCRYFARGHQIPGQGYLLWRLPWRWGPQRCGRKTGGDLFLKPNTRKLRKRINFQYMPTLCKRYKPFAQDLLRHLM